jgi:hypothetical protein
MKGGAQQASGLIYNQGVTVQELAPETVVGIFRESPISRPVSSERVGLELLRLLEVHGIIRIYCVCSDEKLQLLSIQDLPLEMRHKTCQFFAAPRKAHLVAFDEKHDDEEELRKRLTLIANVDWHASAGREFDEFISTGGYKPMGNSAHQHHFPQGDFATERSKSRVCTNCFSYVPEEATECGLCRCAAN